MITRKQTVKKYKVTAGVLDYGVPFPIYERGDVLVVWSDDAEGLKEHTLGLGSDYSVTINSAGNGGMVTLQSGRVPVGATLAVVSNIPETQELDLSHTAEVDTASTEKELDRQVQMIQQLSDTLSRCIKVGITSSMTPEYLLKEIFKVYHDILDSLAHTGFITGAIPVVSTGTTEPRTIKDRFADIINVKDFGAKAGEYKENTNAFNAFDESKGGIKYIPSGIYIDEGMGKGDDHRGILTNIDIDGYSKQYNTVEPHLVPFASIPMEDTAKSLQGYCTDESEERYIYYCTVNNENTVQWIHKFDSVLGKNIIISEHTELTHCNSCCAHDGYLYITENFKIFKLSTSTLEIVDTIDTTDTLGRVNGITWDKNKKQYYIQQYKEKNVIHIVDEKFTVLYDIPCPVYEGLGDWVQDICWHDEKLFCFIFNTWSGRTIGYINYVYTLDSLGNIKHLFMIPAYRELEGIAFYKNNILCGINAIYYGIVDFYTFQIESDKAPLYFHPTAFENDDVISYGMNHYIYVKKQDTCLVGLGTEDNPYSSLRYAVNESYKAAKKGFSYIYINVDGDFSDEILFLCGISKSIFLMPNKDTVLGGLRIIGCPSVRIMAGFHIFPSNNINYDSLCYFLQSNIDIYKNTFTSNNISKIGIMADRCHITFISGSSTFNGFDTSISLSGCFTSIGPNIPIVNSNKKDFKVISSILSHIILDKDRLNNIANIDRVYTNISTQKFIISGEIDLSESVSVNEVHLVSVNLPSWVHLSTPIVTKRCKDPSDADISVHSFYTEDGTPGFTIAYKKYHQEDTYLVASWLAICY